MSQATLKLVGIDASHDIGIQGEEEVRRLLASQQATHLPDDKRELLDNIFELSDRNARQVMVPRADVVYLDIKQSIDDNLRTARESGHTRFPLCDNDLDHVIGLVHIKDLFRGGEMPNNLEKVRREIFFVPETTPLEQILRKMRKARIHMAAVFDEFGGTCGIVTLENVIEEIVGEIQDEFDSEQAKITTLEEGIFKVLGSTLIRDLEDELGVDLGDDRDEDTVAGVVVSELGRRPRVGDSVTFGPLQLEVLEVDANRILALKIRRADIAATVAPS
jgi:CBS domain containing-hemolysin-like protein